MKRRFSESVSALRCAGPFDFHLGRIAALLHDGLPPLGFRLDHAEFVEDEEVVLHGDRIVLSVCRIEQAGHHILVAAETPRGADLDPVADQTRLLLCAAATRLLCQTIQVESISWWHMGKVHATEGTRHFEPVRPAASRPTAEGRLRSALATVKESMGAGGDGMLSRLMRRHFPSAADVILTSDHAA